MKKVRDLIIYILIELIGYIVRRIPRGAGLKLGIEVGNLVYLISKKRRNIAVNNLSMVFGDKLTEKSIDNLARKSFQNMGKTLIEFLTFPVYSTEDLIKMVKIEGKNNFINLMTKGKGVIAITAHFGNWELIFHVLSAFTTKLSAIAQSFKNKALNRLVEEYRTSHGGKIIDKKHAVKQSLDLLNDGFCVIILSDQDAGKNGIFIDFLGVPASTAKGPILFALRTGAYVIEIFDIRQKDDSHIISISEPLKLSITGNIERDIETNTTKIVKDLEELIMKYPSQWLWMHNRWKTKKFYEQPSIE
ncbi:MAG: lysophospholipid acyltransferase family protein [bacterium]